MLIQNTLEAFMLIDDSVQNKHYLQFIKLVKLQYIGAEYGLMSGMSIIIWCIGVAITKISIQLTIVFMRWTRIARPRTNTSLKWLSMLSLPKISKVKRVLFGS